MVGLDAKVTALARWTAIAGGMVLVALTLITVVSVTGRAFVFAGLKPVPGDFELVEAGTAFAIFAFLPWCTISRGHANVELFTLRFPDALNRFIDFLADALMFAVAILLAWRHLAGTLDKLANGETSFILQFPVWWAYAACLLGAAVFIIVTAYCCARSAAELAASLRNRRAGSGK